MTTKKAVKKPARKPAKKVASASLTIRPLAGRNLKRRAAELKEQGEFTRRTAWYPDGEGGVKGVEVKEPACDHDLGHTKGADIAQTTDDLPATGAFGVQNPLNEVGEEVEAYNYSQDAQKYPDDRSTVAYLTSDGTYDYSLAKRQEYLEKYNQELSRAEKVKVVVVSLTALLVLALIIAAAIWG